MLKTNREKKKRQNKKKKERKPPKRGETKNKTEKREMKMVSFVCVFHFHNLESEKKKAVEGKGIIIKKKKERKVVTS